MSTPDYGLGPYRGLIDEDEQEKTGEEFAEDFHKRTQSRYQDEAGQEHVADIDDGYGDDYGFGDEDAHPEIPDAVVVEVDSEGNPVDQRYSNVSDKGVGAVNEYIQAIKKWEAGFSSSDDAFHVEKMKAERQKLIQTLADEGAMGREELKGLNAYISADIAELNRPSPKDGAFSDFLRHRAVIRDRVFGRDNEIDAETYAHSIEKTKDMMREREGIEYQYDVLAVRRDAVLEHWDDPWFVAQVAMHKDNHLRDELLSDFDRKDLNNDTAKIRSQMKADVFREKVKEARSEDTSTASKISAFMELQELGLEVRRDQQSVMNFARDAKGLSDGTSRDNETFELGLSAMEKKRFSSSVLEDFWKTYPAGPERDRVTKETEKDVAKLFSHARKKFDEDFKNGSPDAALSFAVMEKSAEVLLQRGHAHVQNVSAESVEDAEAMMRFQTKDGEKVSAFRKLAKDNAKASLSIVDARMHQQGEIREKRKVMDEEDILTTHDADGNEKEFSIGVDDRPIIEVVDGSTVKISKWKDGFEPGGRFAQSGFDEEAFGKLATGELSLEDIQKRAKSSGFDEASLAEMGLTPKALEKISNLEDRSEAQAAFKDAVTEGHVFRLKNIVAPPVGEQTKDGYQDAGAMSKENLQLLLNQYGHDGLNFKFEKSKDGEENIASINLANGVDVSDEMLASGYAIPLVGEAGARQEKTAQFAEANFRGIWKNGFPEKDATWRRDLRSPKLGAKDKKELLLKTVAESMAGSAGDVRRKLSGNEAQIFALPLRKWAGQAHVDREISRITRSNPARIKKLYANNMEILNDLRERHKKGELSEDEKRAHDRLCVGRRAMAESLVEYGHLDPEQAKKDSHKLLSRDAKLLPKGFRERLVKGSEKAVDVSERAIKKTAKGAKNTINSAIDFAMDP